MKKKHIIFTIILYFILLGTFLQFAFEYYVAGTAVYVLLLLSCIVAGYVCSKRQNIKLRKVSPLLYAVSILLGLVLISGFTVMAAQNFITLHRGEKLIHNINHYQQESGHLPKTLDVLAPDYLAFIPKVANGMNGETFIYSNGRDHDDFKTQVKETHGTILSQEDYYIKFKSYFGVVYYYDSVTNQWHSMQQPDKKQINHPQFALADLLSRIKIQK